MVTSSIIVRMHGVLLLALFAPEISAVSLEYTTFWPDRTRSSQAMIRQWGVNAEWPIKSFPMQDGKRGLGDTYGLVYWPGETVAVRLKGDDAGTVTAITCTEVTGPGKLAVARDKQEAWRISIPPDEGTKPLLKVYRVVATAGGKEVASRGLIVTRPWSSVQGVETPTLPTSNIGMSEWGNGANPWTLMCFSLGIDPTNPTYMPMKSRPWWGVDVFGVPETYWFPRREWRMAKSGKELTSDAYNDPSLEWSAWWTYYAKGCSKWKGEWQWGPWSSMAAERIYPEDGKADYYGMCYSDVKMNGGPMPNGLLFWQWAYQGLSRMSKHSLNLNSPYPEKKLYWEPYDGWQDGLGSVGRSEEVGNMSLYYQRCKAEKLDVSWSQGRIPFAVFSRAQADMQKKGDTRNDYLVKFRTIDLNAMNFAMMHLAETDAVREFAKLDARPDFRNPNLGQPWLDRVPFRPMDRDRRWLSQAWISLFGGGVVGSGGDYTHNSAFINDGTDWFKSLRGYRALGYAGATQAALWPSCLLSGGFRHFGVMPGTKSDHDWSDAAFRRVIDDGTSFRRLDLFERVPMFYRPGGKLCGYDIGHSFGGFYGRYDAQDEFAKDHRWNTLAILAQQVVEIPDRIRPLGGVLVFDSNNDDDRRNNIEFLTDREPWVDYLAALHDALGVITYANPDMAAEIPSDIPRLYAPRNDGNGRAVLSAEIGGRRIVVPYAGQAGQRPDHPAFREFVSAVRQAQAGGWPLSSTGGFVVAGWESSNGVWLVVENPIEEKNRLHALRSGSATIRLRGFTGKIPPIVIDLCGGEEPDPRRIDDTELTQHGEFLTVKLDWARGDSRLFFINFTPDQPASRPAKAKSRSVGTGRR